MHLCRAMFKKIKKLREQFDHWMDYGPPGSLTTAGWRSFEREYKVNAPIRFYLSRTFKRKYVYPLKWRISEIRDWFRYRITDRYHIVKTGLTPHYYEISERMLHANFTMLVDFVEVEHAWSKYIWSDERSTSSWIERRMPFYYIFKPFRRPDLGIEYLEWASTLDDPKLPPHERSDAQAASARKILALYKWWTVDRKARIEIEYLPRPSTSDDYTFDFDEEDEEDEEDIEAEKAYHAERVKRIHARHDQEEKWNEEDTKMLVQLMKISRSLWT